MISRYETHPRDPAIFGRLCFDRENNLIERGMAAVFQGRTYVVGFAGRGLYERSPMVCLDGLSSEGRPERILLSGLYLRKVHILGYRLPLLFE